MFGRKSTEDNGSDTFLSGLSDATLKDHVEKLAKVTRELPAAREAGHRRIDKYLDEMNRRGGKQR